MATNDQVETRNEAHEARKEALWLQQCRRGSSIYQKYHGGYFRKEEVSILRKKDRMH